MLRIHLFSSFFAFTVSDQALILVFGQQPCKCKSMFWYCYYKSLCHVYLDFTGTHQGLLGLQGLRSSFGTQCTAIAFVALLFASVHTDPSTWGSPHMDTIILRETHCTGLLCVSSLMGM